MKLFERTQIGSLSLKNRVVLAPMGTTTDHTNGFDMRDVNFYGERARGGAGLILFLSLGHVCQCIIQTKNIAAGICTSIRPVC